LTKGSIRGIPRCCNPLPPQHLPHSHQHHPSQRARHTDEPFVVDLLHTRLNIHSTGSRESMRGTGLDCRRAPPWRLPRSRRSFVRLHTRAPYAVSLPHKSGCRSSTLSTASTLGKGPPGTALPPLQGQDREARQKVACQSFASSLGSRRSSAFSSPPPRSCSSKMSTAPTHSRTDKSDHCRSPAACPPPCKARKAPDPHLLPSGLCTPWFSP